MNPLLLAIVCFLASQTIAVGMLFASGRRRPLPRWLFPVTGRWLDYLAAGYLVITALGPPAAVMVVPESPSGNAPGLPDTMFIAPWLILEIVWLGLSLGFVALIYVMLPFSDRTEQTASRGKAFLPRNDKRAS